VVNIEQHIMGNRAQFPNTNTWVGFLEFQDLTIEMITEWDFLFHALVVEQAFHF
jgi:hypothetical protein